MEVVRAAEMAAVMAAAVMAAVRAGVVKAKAQTVEEVAAQEVAAKVGKSEVVATGAVLWAAEVRAAGEEDSVGTAAAVGPLATGCNE